MADDKKQNAADALMDWVPPIAGAAALATNAELRNGIALFRNAGVGALVEFKGKCERWVWWNATALARAFANATHIAAWVLILADVFGQYAALMGTHGVRMPGVLWGVPLAALLLNIFCVILPIWWVIHRTMGTEAIPWSWELTADLAFPAREDAETDVVFAQRLRAQVQALRGRICTLALDLAIDPRRRVWRQNVVTWLQGEIMRLDPALAPPLPVNAPTVEDVERFTTAAQRAWALHTTTASDQQALDLLEVERVALGRRLRLMHDDATRRQFGERGNPLLAMAVLICAVTAKGVLAMEWRSLVLNYVCDVQALTSVIPWLVGMGALVLFFILGKTTVVAIHLLASAADAIGMTATEFFRGLAVAAPGITSENVDSKLPKVDWKINLITFKWELIFDEIWYAGIGAGMIVLHAVSPLWSTGIFVLGIGSSLGVYLLKKRGIDVLGKEQNRAHALYWIFGILAGALVFFSLLNMTFGWWTRPTFTGAMVALQGGELLWVAGSDILKLLAFPFVGIAIVLATLGMWFFTLGWLGFFLVGFVLAVLLFQLGHWSPEGNARWLKYAGMTLAGLAMLVLIGGRAQQIDGRSLTERSRMVGVASGAIPAPPPPSTPPDDQRGPIRHAWDRMMGTAPWINWGSSSSGSDTRAVSSAPAATLSSSRHSQERYYRPDENPPCEDLDGDEEYRAMIRRNGMCH